MKKSLLATLAFAMASLAAVAVRAQSASAPAVATIHRCLDAFNAGDMKTFLEAYAAGEITRG